MVQVVMVVLIVLFIATVVVLIRKYAVTRDRGLLWLGVALVIWPLIISPLMNYGIAYGLERCSSGDLDRCIDLFPFTLVEQGVITIGQLFAVFQYIDRIIFAIFGLVAVTQLYRNTDRNSSTPQPVSVTNAKNPNQKDDKNKPFATAA